MRVDLDELSRALTLLGGVLAVRGHAYRVAAIGGGALLLLGVIDRSTRDLDLVGVIDPNLRSARPLPEPLAEAVRDVAVQLGLQDDWLNAGPTDLLDLGLPDGFSERLDWRSFGTLDVGLASRFDQVHFKLYAAADQGPGSRHAQDLLALRPSGPELVVAAVWCRTQDPSEAFDTELEQCVAFVTRQLDG